MYRILVASDGSAPATRALAVAAEAVRGKGECRLHVLSVLEAVDEDVRRLIPAAEIERVLAAEAAESRAAVDAVLGPLGVEADFHALSGDPAERIVEHARALAVDQIVMGTRGRGPVAGWLLGSVAARVVQFAHCPVTLVR